MRHDFADGKYTVIHEPGKLTALRNGEPWQDLVGNNLVYWMLVEVDHLKEELAKVTAPVAPAEPMKLADEFELRRLLAEERETTRQLVRALAEATQGTTFMGEPVLPAAPVAPAALLDLLDKRRSDSYSCGVLCDDIKATLAAAPKFIHCLDAWAAWHLRTRGKFVDPTRIPTGELRESFLAFRRGALDERRIGLPTGPVRGRAYSAGLAWRLRACPPIIEPDDWRRWYEDAMCASNEAGFVGMTAAQTIHALVRELEDAKRGSS